MDIYYVGLKKIDKRTGEQWQVIDNVGYIRLKNCKTGRVRCTTFYRFEKWYVSAAQYRHIKNTKRDTLR